MKRLPAILLALFLVGALLPPGVAAAWQGLVVDVTDGDTLLVERNGREVKVRLAEVDAPETGQPWAIEARRALASLVADRRVRVEETDRDRYGRSVARVRVGGRDVAEQLVRAGHVWHYRAYSDSVRLAALEAQARAERTGLWSARRPISPWDWRAERRGRSASPPRPSPGDQQAAADSCATKRRCSQMRSCAEAMTQFRVCGLRGLDSDGDGTPCESLCR